MIKFDKFVKILEGVSTLLFLFPKKNKSKIILPDTSVSVALKNDWEKIGADMWQAFQVVESKYQTPNNYKDHNDRLGNHPQEHL